MMFLFFLTYGIECFLHVPVVKWGGENQNYKLKGFPLPVPWSWILTIFHPFLPHLHALHTGRIFQGTFAHSSSQSYFDTLEFQHGDVPLDQELFDVQDSLYMRVVMVALPQPSPILMHWIKQIPQDLFVDVLVNIVLWRGNCGGQGDKTSLSRRKMCVISPSSSSSKKSSMGVVLKM